MRKVEFLRAFRLYVCSSFWHSCIDLIFFESKSVGYLLLIAHAMLCGHNEGLGILYVESLLWLGMSKNSGWLIEMACDW